MSNFEEKLDISIGLAITRESHKGSAGRIKHLLRASILQAHREAVAEAETKARVSEAEHLLEYEQEDGSIRLPSEVLRLYIKELTPTAGGDDKSE